MARVEATRSEIIDNNDDDGITKISLGSGFRDEEHSESDVKRKDKP
jgi:hypothetical protein